jgi:hypothetical protein
MVLFEVDDPGAFHRATRERGLWIDPIAPGRFRAVTHLDVSSDDLDVALGIIDEVARAGIR